MNAVYIFIAILIPILGGVLIPLLKFRKRLWMEIYIEAVVLLTSALVFVLLIHRPENSVTVMHFAANLTIAFKIDGLSMVFAGLISFLWPLATLYSFEYMKHEEREQTFFMFYTLTYGITLGIATSANLVTMYFFYEMLTLVTLPLVFHTMTREAVLASRRYLYYSLGGAAFAFIGLIFVLTYGSGSSDFVMGGMLNLAGVRNRNMLLLVYVLAFFGFGVKAALCPFNSWLPKAGVAPTPVTALLHAVAVVKSGAFAILRITYYNFGTVFLKDTWAQNVVMAATIITIVYGCSMAVRERHLKRRLAYSTISNLSYILFGAAIMTPLGLVGALCHMVFHAFMKICSFFCAGAVIYKTGRQYVYELDGFGRRMPKVFSVFAVSSLALMGVPGLCGFISKWNLARAAVMSENPLAYVGIGALLISALLTGVYMLTIVVRAFFPGKDFDYGTVSDVKDPNWYMIAPLLVFTAAMFVFGLHPGPIVGFFEQIAEGLL